MMLLRLLGVVCFLVFMLAQSATGSVGVLKMSTTTSTQSSGLLDLLLPEFKRDTGIDVKVIAKGTGAAIRDGMDGNVDIIFVHAKDREKKFVEDGYGTKRYPVMHNDFVILGPASDPAGVKTIKQTSQALASIAKAGSLFISRGDDSGTHTKEQFLWKATGLPLTDNTQTIIKKGKKKKIHYSAPENSQTWYRSIGQGMGKTLTFAEEKQAYTLSDRGTYIKYKFGKTPALDLEIVSEGGPELANPYGIIPVNPERHAHVRSDLAMSFVTWITSQKGQDMIDNYRLEGKQLFYPDAM